MTASLIFDRSNIKIKYLVKIDISDYPVVDALVKIGNPSIPAVIQNLAETEDGQVIELSLEVLYRIEGDKDIVQLRLQKASFAESDPIKKRNSNRH